MGLGRSGWHSLRACWTACCCFPTSCAQVGAGELPSSVTRVPAEPPPHRCRRPQVAARLQLLEELVGYPEVVVVGGGYAGVELAAVVAERLRGRARIKLVTSTADILPGSPQVGGWHGQACLLPPCFCLCCPHLS